MTAARRHRKVVKQAKGFRWGRSKIFSLAKNAVVKAGQHAFVGRRRKKRDFRRLWIVRISAALFSLGKNYSLFTCALRKKNVQVNRKMLSEIAFSNPEIFKQIVEKVSS